MHVKENILGDELKTKEYVHISGSLRIEKWKQGESSSLRNNDSDERIAG